MTTVSAHGIGAELPAGFEAHIYQRTATGVEQTFPVAHFATFPIPPGTGDFGGGATTLMGPADVFVVLFEYGPDSLGTKLFSAQGMPRTLRPDDIKAHVLRRGIPGQGGTQLFFTEGNRPFTLYVVVGSYTNRAQPVPKVNDLLGAIAITPRPALERTAQAASPGGAAGAAAQRAALAVEQWN